MPFSIWFDAADAPSNTRPDISDKTNPNPNPNPNPNANANPRSDKRQD